MNYNVGSNKVCSHKLGIAECAVGIAYNDLMVFCGVESEMTVTVLIEHHGGTIALFYWKRLVDRADCLCRQCKSKRHNGQSK